MKSNKLLFEKNVAKTAASELRSSEAGAKAFFSFFLILDFLFVVQRKAKKKFAVMTMDVERYEVK